MRRLILLVVMLLAFQLPALGHTTHTHTCNSVHGFTIEGSWKHDARRSEPTPGQYRSVSFHYQWEYPNVWVYKHSVNSAWCLE